MRHADLLGGEIETFTGEDEASFINCNRLVEAEFLNNLRKARDLVLGMLASVLPLQEKGVDIDDLHALELDPRIQIDAPVKRKRLVLATRFLRPIVDLQDNGLFG